MYVVLESLMRTLKMLSCIRIVCDYPHSHFSTSQQVKKVTKKRVKAALQQLPPPETDDKVNGLGICRPLVRRLPQAPAQPPAATGPVKR